jgi:cytoskeletal protein RodZ
MYDIKPLEREWKKYRKKKLKPWLIASVSFIVAGVLAIVLLDNTKIDFSTFDTSFMQADNTSSDEEKKVYHHTVKSNVLLNTALNKLETEKKVMDQVNNAANDSTNTFIDIPILDGKHENSVGSRQKGRAKVHLDIMETSSVTAYKDV